ncbi:HVO_A0556 family zinc finger protein [Halorussus halophilus]|uniref:HVO_A0556 family zinc finger protein n=1 Tax=Halorussus halophilus TaxID=2650975 RepID=UPI0017888635|nr:HVO_A0556 family zinc finger protein [Halorussus halophilus]
MQEASPRTAAHDPISALVGDDCSWCANGALTRAEFKGDDAAVCDDCGTPAARVW